MTNEIDRIEKLLDQVLELDFENSNNKDLFAYGFVLLQKAYEFLASPIAAGIDDEDLSPDIRSHLSLVMKETDELSQKVNDFVLDLSSNGPVRAPSMVIALIVNAMYLIYSSNDKLTNSSSSEIENLVKEALGQFENQKQDKNPLDGFYQLMREMENND